jgi:hypothetical protein
VFRRIGIQLGIWTQIGNPDPDPGRQKIPTTKSNKLNIFLEVLDGFSLGRWKLFV